MIFGRKWATLPGHGLSGIVIAPGDLAGPAWPPSIPREVSQSLQSSRTVWFTVRPNLSHACGGRPRRWNVSARKLSYCLQDCGAGASGNESAVAGDIESQRSVERRREIQNPGDFRRPHLLHGSRQFCCGARCHGNATKAYPARTGRPLYLPVTRLTAFCIIAVMLP